MPQLNEASEALLRGEQAVASRFKRFFTLFGNFALKDNVLEVATGLIIAATFTTLVTSFVSDMLLPIISLLPFINKQLEEKFSVLRPGPNYNETIHNGYNTPAQAVDDGAIVLSYGSFLNNVVNFLGVALTLFAIANFYTFLSKDEVIKETVRCKFCRKWISKKAQRCINCTTWQDGMGKELLKVGYENETQREHFEMQ